MNKKYLGLFVVIVLCAIAYAQAPNVLVYLEQGGAKQVVASGGEIEGDASKTSDALNSLSPLVATKVLEQMTINEVRALASLPPIEGGDVTQTQAAAAAQPQIPQA